MDNARAISRRGFLLGLAAAPLAGKLALRGAFAQERGSPPIYSSASPFNRAFDFSSLSNWIVPNSEFYLRSHFPVPNAGAGAWTIKVEGAVEQPRSFTLEEIAALPIRELPVTLECAGNLVGYGGVSNARWGGVSLNALLRAVKVSAGAVEVVLSGADGGPEREASNIQISAFARAIPVSKALDPDTILAYRMNRETLPAVHGGPVRAIVPGFYGMDSVKWINRILVVREPFTGFYQTKRYYDFT
ncbi:MAG TPA: molybdopterin-dependent oxidoreductase, partial [Blastocatellia bacterium]|nr:molybdopterin-dependent oxidoreductase [Blastocatellia bacterium]